MVRARLSLLCAGVFIVAACSGDDEPDVVAPPAEPPAFTLRPVVFDALNGFGDADDLRPFAQAMTLSCEALMRRADDAPANSVERFEHPVHTTLSGTVADWRQACGAIRALVLAGADTPAVKEVLRTHFAPVEITAPDSLFTGYFEPSYEAMRTPEPPYTAPVLTRPADLVTVDLGAFSDDFAGRDLVGRINGTRLVPYADAAEIADAPPDADVLGYVDPNDLLFLQIQGSGRLVFPDGSVTRAGYAMKNGRAYVAVGKTLVDEGHMALEDVSMQSIHAWLSAAAPEDAARVRHSNPSYVFFRALNLADPAGGPIGAQGVQLTDGVSLAVDRRYHAMGTPMWLETEGDADNPPLSRLMVAQDTGGAIRGPVRGDVFYGAGDEAAALAGTMNAPGRLVLLLPKPVAARLLRAES